MDSKASDEVTIDESGTIKEDEASVEPAANDETIVETSDEPIVEESAVESSQNIFSDEIPVANAVVADCSWGGSSTPKIISNMFVNASPCDP